MSTMNPLDPYGGSTPPIEQMIGTAYDNVRKVAQNIEVIRAVNDNKENIDKAAQISDDVLTLKEEMIEAVDTSTANANTSTAAANVATEKAGEALSSAQSANTAKNDAVTAATTAVSLVGSVSKAILSFPSLFEAQAAAATLPDGQRVEIDADETRESRRTRYVVQGGLMVFAGFVETELGGGSLPAHTAWSEIPKISSSSAAQESASNAQAQALLNRTELLKRVAIPYDLKADAVAAAANGTLVDGMQVDALDVQERYKVQGGALVFVDVKSPAKSTWFAGGITGPELAGLVIDVVENLTVSRAPYAAVMSSNGSSLTLTDSGETIQLGATPVVINSHAQTEIDGVPVRYSNVRLGTDAAPQIANDSTAYANTFIGDMAGKNVTGGVFRTTAVGTASARDIVRGYSLVGVGSNTFKWSEYVDRNVAIGDNSCINLGQTQAKAAQVNGIYNGATTLAVQFDARYPAWRAKYWSGNLPAPAVCMTAADFGNKATHNVALGRNALGFSITAINSVAVGYDAGTSAIDANNMTAVGDRCMQYSIDVLNSAAIGSSVLSNTAKVNQTVAMGNLAGSNYTISEQNVMLGYQALRGSTSLPNGATATGNVAIGRIAGANGGAGLANSVMIGHAAMSGEGVSGDGHTAIGHRALGSLGAGTNGNTANGKDALRYLTSGNFNSALGTDCLSLMMDGSNATSLNYATGVGWGARVSGDNQLQLGSSAVTSYAYGAVQDRSDKYDKAEIDGMPDAMVQFTLGLRAVQGVWDMRDDYVLEMFPPEEAPEPPELPEKPEIPSVADAQAQAESFFAESGDVSEALIAVKAANIIEEAESALGQWLEENQPKIEQHQSDCKAWAEREAARSEAAAKWWSNPTKDGSKKRTRRHNWFIAQEVKALADRLGIDFAGLQHHLKAGGADVYSLGYTEFIPPIQHTLAKCWARVDRIEEKQAEQDQTIQMLIERIEQLEAR